MFTNYTWRGLVVLTLARAYGFLGELVRVRVWSPRTRGKRGGIMYATTFLEWWNRGKWVRIGWTGDTPERADDLREHGARLAAGGGYYRLVQPSVYVGAPPVVVHEWA